MRDAFFIFLLWLPALCVLGVLTIVLKKVLPPHRARPAVKQIGIGIASFTVLAFALERYTRYGGVDEGMFFLTAYVLAGGGIGCVIFALAFLAVGQCFIRNKDSAA